MNIQRIHLLGLAGILFSLPLSLSGQPQALGSMASPLAPPTGSTSPRNPAYYRDNFERLFASDAINTLELSADALKDPKIGRLLFEKFKAELRAGRFWSVGVSLLSSTNNSAFAPLLWQEWKNLPAYEPPATNGWGNIQHQLSHPKSAIVHAVFGIGEIETARAVWAAFPGSAEGDQLLIASAANNILDPVAAAEAMRVFDSAKSERVRAELVNSANRILYFVFTSGPEADRRRARRVAEPLLADLQKRGLVRDFLAQCTAP
jgi:hypothetical protein